MLDKLKSVELPAVVLPFNGLNVERRTDTSSMAAESIRTKSYAMPCRNSREPKAVDYHWYRFESVFAYLVGWLRGKGVQGIKPIHALRKLYGSVLAERHGIHAASSGLRHANIRTTGEFYADRTVKLTGGFGSALSSSGAGVLSF